MQLKTYNEILAKIKHYQFIVIDSKITAHYPEVKDLLKGKCVFSVEEPENNKNIEIYQQALHYFLQGQITRQDQILVIGGGATSDLGGFVAATILRGVAWDVIPTTLLAMIDACIGGKVGINSPLGKNLIGAFHLPQNIYLCHDFLQTLPPEEINSGKGEMLKYLLLDKDIHDYFQANGFNETLISLCAKYKQKIVDQDLRENGARVFLNLGHTFGHGIEKTLAIPHGVAVAYGIKMVFELLDETKTKIWEELTQKLEIKLTPLSKMNFQEFWKFVSVDKKRSHVNSLNMVLLEEVGHPYMKAIDLMEVKKRLQENPFYENYFQ